MKSKSEMNRALRARRKAQGLVELRVWLTPEKREKVLEFLKAESRPKLDELFRSEIEAALAPSIKRRDKKILALMKQAVK